MADTSEVQALERARSSQIVEGAAAELAIAAHRLRMVGRSALTGEQIGGSSARAWESVSCHCAQALGSIALAMEALPDADWTSGVGERMVVVGNLAIDPTARQAWLGPSILTLSRQEFAFLSTLASDPARAWTKQELLELVWGFESRGRTRTVDTHASRVRKKLLEAGAPAGEFVVNVWGIGYALVRPAPSARGLPID